MTLSFRLTSVRWKSAISAETGNFVDRTPVRVGMLSAATTCPKCQHSFRASVSDRTLSGVLGPGAVITCPRCGLCEMGQAVD